MAKQDRFEVIVSHEFYKTLDNGYVTITEFLEDDLRKRFGEHVTVREISTHGDELGAD